MMMEGMNLLVLDASPWMPVLMVSGGHLMQQEQSMARVDTLIMPAVTPI